MEHDIFESVKSAVLCAPINVHRLQQLSAAHAESAISPGLYEETVTDLLLNEMIGDPYVVEALCPECQDPKCAEWGKGGEPSGKAVYARPLTRYEEGGNRRNRAAGAGADWILEIRDKGKSTRFLFQAKSQTVPSRSNRRGMNGARISQIDQLRDAGRKYDAAAFYVIYLCHAGAHFTTETVCGFRRFSYDTSLLVISERNVRQLQAEGRVNDWKSYARPFSCITGCECLGTQGQGLAVASLAFIQEAYPDYAPKAPTPIVGIPSVFADSSVTTWSSRWSSPDSRRVIASSDQRGVAVYDDGIMIVRTGGPSYSSIDREKGSQVVRRVGWHIDPPLTRDEWREATRMYWRASLKRARRVKFLVASHRGKIYGVYRVRRDGVRQHTALDNRVEFLVEEIPSTDSQYNQICKIATPRLKEVAGSRSPFVYADIPVYESE